MNRFLSKILAIATFATIIYIWILLMEIFSGIGAFAPFIALFAYSYGETTGISKGIEEGKRIEKENMICQYNLEKFDRDLGKIFSKSK
ncbi:MAG: hypothetical protein WCX97_04895 [Candidatus Magasanikbacteria bacterium]